MAANCVTAQSHDIKMTPPGKIQAKPSAEFQEFVTGRCIAVGRPVVTLQHHLVTDNCNVRFLKFL